MILKGKDQYFRFADMRKRPVPPRSLPTGEALHGVYRAVLDNVSSEMREGSPPLNGRVKTTRRAARALVRPLSEKGDAFRCWEVSSALAAALPEADEDCVQFRAEPEEIAASLDQVFGPDLDAIPEEETGLLFEICYDHELACLQNEGHAPAWVPQCIRAATSVPLFSLPDQVRS